ncbi:MAG: DUF4129 domain-containing protein [Anaerolineae bacterium]|nr:DUF4129 domain-containing protein [Anaerolineae bacterium]
MATAVAPGPLLIMSENTNTSEPIQPYIVQSWTQTVIRPTLIILMVTALMGAILAVAISVNPSHIWYLGFLICFFVILESYFTTAWLEKPARRNLHHLNYRGAELLVLVVALRLLTWWIQGNWPESSAVLSYLKSPFTLFDDGYFWAIFGLSLIAWQRTIAITRSFSLMKPDEAELAYYTLPRNERDANSQPLSDDRSHLQQGFVQQFLGGGLVVLICAGLASYNLSEFGNVETAFSSGLTRLGLSPSMLASLLLYFLCGFLLLSQSRLAILEMRWLAGDVKQRTPIGRHWHRRTLFVVLAIGLIAAFLPVGSTLPFVRILNLIIFGFITIITTLIYLASLLFYSILSLIFRRGTAVEEPPPPPPSPPSPPPQVAPLIETSETLQYIFSSAFWAIVIVACIIAFAFFLRDRGIKLDNAFLQRTWLTLKLWWQQLRQGINEQMQDIQGGLQSLFTPKSTEETKKQPPWHFVRVNALSPREKVYYFYLSTVKRADQKGVSRQKSETPLEFADDLKATWPDAEKEIEELTGAFLQARYSPDSIEEEDVIPVKNQWKRLKTNLRKQKHDH